MTKPPAPLGERASPSSLQQVFGTNLRVARTRRGMTQDDLAEACGQNRTHISRIEAGAVNLTLETAASLAQAVGLRVIDLFVTPEEFKQETQQFQTTGILPQRQGVLAIELPENEAFEAAMAAARRIGRPLHLIDPATREIRAVITGQ